MRDTGYEIRDNEWSMVRVGKMETMKLRWRLAVSKCETVSYFGFVVRLSKPPNETLFATAKRYTGFSSVLTLVFKLSVNILF